MKKLFWKFRYARRLKKFLLVTWVQAFDSAESALEMVDYDLTEDPHYLAYEEYNACMQDAE